jgi:integrase
VDAEEAQRCGLKGLTLADLLGHSSIAITGDVFGHTSDDAARAAIAGLSGALGL